MRKKSPWLTENVRYMIYKLHDKALVRLEKKKKLKTQQHGITINLWETFDLPASISESNDLNNYFLLNQNRNFTPDPQLLDYISITYSLYLWMITKFSISLKLEHLVMTILLLILLNTVFLQLYHIWHTEVDYCVGHNIFTKECKTSLINPISKVNKPSDFSDIKPISILYSRG